MATHSSELLGYHCPANRQRSLIDDLAELSPLAAYQDHQPLEFEGKPLPEALALVLPIVWARSWVVRYPGGRELPLASSAIAAAIVLAKRQHESILPPRRAALGAWAASVFRRAQALSAHTNPKTALPWAISAAHWRVISKET